MHTHTHGTTHITITQGGRSCKVQQFIQRVIVVLDGVNVLVVGVVSIHNHTQLTAWKKTGRRGGSKFLQLHLPTSTSELNKDES